jgi:hypothetical protein
VEDISKKKDFKCGGGGSGSSSNNSKVSPKMYVLSIKKHAVD